MGYYSSEKNNLSFDLFLECLTAPEAQAWVVNDSLAIQIARESAGSAKRMYGVFCEGNRQGSAWLGKDGYWYGRVEQGIRHGPFAEPQAAFIPIIVACERRKSTPNMDKWMEALIDVMARVNKRN